MFRLLDLSIILPPVILYGPVPPINLATWTFILPETLHQLVSSGVFKNWKKVLEVI